jgi:CheY-like chemotaxis protein
METAPNWFGKTILVVEDDKFTSFIIQNFAKNPRPTIIALKMESKAVELALETPTRCNPMDIKKAGNSGIEATQRIREYMPNTIIIAQTAFVSETDKANAINAGCNEFITKPLSSEKVLGTIARYL